MRERHWRSAQVWHALSSDHTVLPVTHARVHPRTEWNLLAVSFPAEPDLQAHLRTAEVWKPELA